jgi:hypothetical protein
VADLITKMDKQQQVVTEDAHSEDLKLSCGLRVIDMNATRLPPEACTTR